MDSWDEGQSSRQTSGTSGCKCKIPAKSGISPIRFRAFQPQPSELGTNSVDTVALFLAAVQVKTDGISFQQVV